MCVDTKIREITMWYWSKWYS